MHEAEVQACTILGCAGQLVRPRLTPSARLLRWTHCVRLYRQDREASSASVPMAARAPSRCLNAPDQVAFGRGVRGFATPVHS